MNTATRSRHGRNRSSSGRSNNFFSSRPRHDKFSNARPKRSGGGSNHGNFSRGRRQSPRGGKKRSTFDPSQFINTNPVSVNEEIYTPKNSFETFGLNPKLVETVHAIGIHTPTPIQDQIIPEIMAGRDVIGLAETGTGKTAAFLIPLIEKTIRDSNHQTLILTPTRELALQIEEELRTLSRGFRLFSVTAVGGVNINPQIKALRRPNHFVIGTAGRILDLLKRKSLSTKSIKTVVLDEADRMLDMGFVRDIRAILKEIPDEREMLLFSATMSNDTGRIVHDFLRNPVTVSVKKKDVTDNILQDIVLHKHHDKFETLIKLLSKPEYKRVLVFGSMKHSVEKLARQLSHGGIEAESIHGNKGQGQRQRALSKFKKGEVNVLVATDVAARGIHVEDVTHVINYDLPNTFEDYVHRIGRTGRANKRGKALTFVPTKV